MSLTGADREYCIGTDVNVQLVGSPSGGTYGSGNSFNPSNLPAGQYSFTYIVNANSTGCPNIGYAYCFFLCLTFIEL